MFANPCSFSRLGKVVSMQEYRGVRLKGGDEGSWNANRMKTVLCNLKYKSPLLEKMAQICHSTSKPASAVKDI